MTPQQYSKARTDLSYKVDEWCAALCISRSSHKKYLSGDREIPERVKRSIALLQENYELKRENFYLKHRK